MKVIILGAIIIITALNSAFAGEKIKSFTVKIKNISNILGPDETFLGLGKRNPDIAFEINLCYSKNLSTKQLRYYFSKRYFCSSIVTTEEIVVRANSSTLKTISLEIPLEDVEEAREEIYETLQENGAKESLGRGLNDFTFIIQGQERDGWIRSHYHGIAAIIPYADTKNLAIGYHLGAIEADIEIERVKARVYRYKNGRSSEIQAATPSFSVFK